MNVSEARVKYRQEEDFFKESFWPNLNIYARLIKTFMKETIV